MSFYQNVTASTLLDGNSSLDVGNINQEKSWFSSGNQLRWPRSRQTRRNTRTTSNGARRRGRKKGRKLRGNKEQQQQPVVTIQYPSRPITVNNMSNVPIAAVSGGGRGRGRKFVMNPPQIYNRQNRPQTTANFLKEKVQYARRAQTTEGQSKNSPRQYIKTGAREKKVYGVQHPFRSTQIAILLKLKEELTKNELNKEKMLQACIYTLYELKNDINTGVSEIMQIILPHLLNATYRNTVGDHSNNIISNSPFNNLIPYYKIVDELEEQHEENNSQENSFQSKLRIHRKAQHELRDQLKNVQNELLTLTEKLESEKIAHRSTKIELEQAKIKNNKSTEQNMNLLGMLSTSETQRHNYEKENRKIVTTLKRDLIASKENNEAHAQALVSLQEEMEHLRLPEEKRSEVGRLKKELNDVINTLAMQRGQYLALVEKSRQTNNHKNNNMETNIDFKKYQEQLFWNYANTENNLKQEKYCSHLVEKVQIVHDENALHSFCERVYSEVLNIKDCANFIINAYDTFKEEHFDLLEINKLTNEEEMLEEDDESGSDNDDDGNSDKYRKFRNNSDTVISIKIYQEFLTFISFLKAHVTSKHGNRWISQQSVFIDASSLHTAKEKRKRQEILPFIFIQNVMESIAQYRFYSYKFNVFHHVLNQNVHVGCIHDQELMMLALKKKLISLDVDNTGFIDVSSFKKVLKKFLTRNLREEDFKLLNNAIEKDVINGSKYAYGYIFDDFSVGNNNENSSMDIVRHDNTFAKELKLLHLYSSIYYRNCFIERILALKGIDGKVDPSEIRRAIKLIDPKRIENSLDNIVGLIMQYHNYFQMKKKGLDDANNNKKKKSGSSGGASDLSVLRAQAAAFAAARDRSKRIPCEDVIDALNYFYMHEWKWWC